MNGPLAPVPDALGLVPQNSTLGVGDDIGDCSHFTNDNGNPQRDGRHIYTLPLELTTNSLINGSQNEGWDWDMETTDAAIAPVPFSAPITTTNPPKKPKTVTFASERNHDDLDLVPVSNTNNNNEALPLPIEPFNFGEYMNNRENELRKLTKPIEPQSEIDSVQKIILECRNDILRKNQIINSLTEALEKAILDNQHKDKYLEEMNREIYGLQEQVKVAELAEKLNENTEKTDHFTALVSRESQTVNDLDDSKQQLFNLKQKYEINLKYLEEQTIKHEKERGDYKRTIAQMEFAIEEIKKDKEKAESHIHQQKSEIDDYELRLEESKSKLAELAEKLKENTEKTDHLTALVNRESQTVNDLDDSKHQLFQLTQKYEANLKCLEEQTVEHETERDEYKRTIAQMELDIEEIKRDKEKAESRIHQQQLEIDDYEVGLKESKVAELAEKLKYDSNVKHLEEQTRELESERDEYKRTIAQMELAIEEIKKDKLNQNTERTNNSTATPLVSKESQTINDLDDSKQQLLNLKQKYDSNLKCLEVQTFERDEYKRTVAQLEFTIEEMKKDKLNENTVKTDHFTAFVCKESQTGNDLDDSEQQLLSLKQKYESNLKYLEEQTIERETERDEYNRSIAQMEFAIEEIKRDKDKAESHIHQQQLEIDDYEVRLKESNEAEQDLKLELEANEYKLKSAVDKICELREIIRDLEDQTDATTREVLALKEENQRLAEELEHLHQFKAQADADETLNTSHDTYVTADSEICEELHMQVGELSFRLEKKLNEFENFKWTSRPGSSCSGAMSSTEDISVRENPMFGYLSAASGIPENANRETELSNALRRLETQFENFIRFEEIIMKKLKDTELRVEKVLKRQEELEMDKQIAHEQIREQMVKIADFENRIDSTRIQPAQPTGNSLSGLREKVKALTDELERCKGQLHLREVELEHVTEKFEANQAILKKYNSSPTHTKPKTLPSVLIETQTDSIPLYHRFAQTDRKNKSINSFAQTVHSNTKEIGLQTRISNHKQNLPEIFDVSQIQGMGTQGPVHSTPNDGTYSRIKSVTNSVSGSSKAISFADAVVLRNAASYGSPEAMRDAHHAKSFFSSAPNHADRKNLNSSNSDETIKGLIQSSEREDPKTFIRKLTNEIDEAINKTAEMVPGAENHSSKVELSIVGTIQPPGHTIDSEHDSILRKVSELANLVDVLTQEKQALETELKRLEEANKDRVAQLETLVDKMEAEHAVLQEQAGSLTRQLQSEIRDRRCYESRFNNARQSLESQKEVDNNLKLENKKLEMHLNALKEQVQNLNDQLQQQGSAPPANPTMALETQALEAQIERLEEANKDRVAQLETLVNKMETERAVLQEQVISVTRQLQSEIRDRRCYQNRFDNARQRLESQKEIDNNLKLENRKLEMHLNALKEQVQGLNDQLQQQGSAPLTNPCMPGSYPLPLVKQQQSELYLRTKSYRKALTWQKKYLAMVIIGYKELLNLSGAGLEHPDLLQNEIPITPTCVGLANRKSPLTKFRIYGKAIIATIRMKFMVRRWDHKVKHHSTSRSSSVHIQFPVPDKSKPDAESEPGHGEKCETVLSEYMKRIQYLEQEVGSILISGKRLKENP